MGLLSVIRKLKQREKEMRILVLGLDNAGKTTFLKRLRGEDTSQVAPTLGFNIDTLDLPPYRLTFWDVGGQRSLRAFWRNYFEETDGLIWVVDSADEARAAESAAELAALVAAERLAQASVLVLANKRDVDGAMSLDALRAVLQLPEREGLLLAPADSRSGKGLDEAVRWLVDDIAAKLFL